MALALSVAACGNKNEKAETTTTGSIETTTTATSDSTTTTGAGGATTIPTTGVTTPSFLLKGKSFKEAVEHLSGREKPFYCTSERKAVWYDAANGLLAAWGDGNTGVHLIVKENTTVARRWTSEGDSFTYANWVTTANPRTVTVDSLPKTLSDAMVWIGYDPSGAGEVTTGDDVSADYTYKKGENQYVATVALSGGGDAGLVGIGLGGFSAACEVQSFDKEGPKTLAPIPGVKGEKFPASEDTSKAASVSEAEWNALVG